MSRKFSAKVGIPTIGIFRSWTDDQDTYWQSGEKVLPTSD